MARRKNARPQAHLEEADEWITASWELLDAAQEANASGAYEDALAYSIVATATLGAAAAHLGESCGATRDILPWESDVRSLKIAASGAGQQISKAVCGLYGQGRRRRRGVAANPSDTPVVNVVLKSPTFLTSNQLVYLTIGEDGKIQDAFVGPPEEWPKAMPKDLTELPTIDLDVTMGQYGKVKRFAKQLAKLRKVEPSLRRERRTAANPDKLRRRLMR